MYDSQIKVKYLKKINPYLKKDFAIRTKFEDYIYKKEAMGDDKVTKQAKGISNETQNSCIVKDQVEYRIEADESIQKDVDDY